MRSASSLPAVPLAPAGDRSLSARASFALLASIMVSFLAGSAAQARRLVEVARELLLEQAVNPAHLLLLAQTQAILAELDASLTVLTRRIRPAHDGAFLGKAAIALEVELGRLAATEFTDST